MPCKKSNNMTNPRKIVFSFCFLLLGGLNLWAQRCTDASGGEATGHGGTASYSIGQIDYVTASGSGQNITQGVQQPYEILVVSDGGEVCINLAPNPTTAFVVLSIECTKEDNYSYEIYDVLGKFLGQKNLTRGETNISVANFADAVYFMRVLNNEKQVRTFKIVKTNK